MLRWIMSNKFAGLIVIWCWTIGGRHVKFRMGTCHKNVYLWMCEPFLYSRWTSADMAVRIICGKFKIWSVLEEIMYRSGWLNCEIIYTKFFVASSRKSNNFAESSHRTFCNVICFYGEELLAPHPTPKLEGHPLSAVHDCIFNIFAAAPHIGSRSSICNLRTRHRLRVFENMVLRGIFGPQKDEITGEWRKLHNEELNDLYSSPNIIRVIKLRRMRWAGHVTCMGERRGYTGFWRGNQRERGHLE